MSTKAVPEVRKVISSGETLRLTFPMAFFLHIEIRQKQNGSWVVFYPDEAFIPCDTRCQIKHSHDHQMRWIETHYQPTDFDDAMLWADSISDGREVKVIPFERKGRQPST